ncbi:hypothetical protein [Candidatus Proelusimicrobium volucris]|uniref:LPD3 domain-containing protein n=1 Tax=Candidatus Proelusimicrobium volucris TaxID=3416225 RepID=UPI003D118183
MEKFKNEVQNVLADDKVSPRTELSLGETPQIYVNLGLPKGELKTNKMTLLKALGKTGKHPHNVPIKVLEELPALIMDPQAVFKSLSTSSNPSGYISVLDAVDKAGKPIIAVISPNKKDENEISFIPSVYERNNFNNFVSNVIKENGVLYIKERTVLPSLHNAVLQRNTVPTNKILTKEDIVKGYLEESPKEPIEITGTELGDYTDIKDFRAKAIDWYKANLQGKTVKHPQLGEILFSRKGRDEYEAFSGNPDKLKMVVALYSIIETGRYLGSEPLHKIRKDGAICFHLIENMVKIGRGTAQKVKVIVWEDTNGKKFYDLKIPKKELQ